MPLPHKPGWVWDDGAWRPETPEEARQRGPQLRASDANSDGQGGSEDGERGEPAGGGNGGEKGGGIGIGGDDTENESGVGGKDGDKNADDIETARRGELGSILKLVDRIQNLLARDPEVFDKLPPELRTFYTAYQEHVRLFTDATDRQKRTH